MRGLEKQLPADVADESCKSRYASLIEQDDSATDGGRQMSAMTAEWSPLVTPATEFEFESRTWEIHTARFAVHWGRRGAVIAAHGEIDAVSAGPLVDCVLGCADSCEWLVVDLSDLEFLGAAGFSALRRIGIRCADTDVRWALVPGSATSRLLRVCDPHGYLPVAESVPTALADVQNQRLRSVQYP